MDMPSNFGITERVELKLNSNGSVYTPLRLDAPNVGHRPRFNPHLLMRIVIR